MDEQISAMLKWKVKAHISVKTLILVQTPILKLWLCCFYSNLSKCWTRL